jgi:hypothetical protein
MVAFVVLVYSYPALRTSATTGSRQLPALNAPDLSLYLNISRLTSPTTGVITNPYYGVDVPSSASGHLQFPVAFQLFGRVLSVFRGDLWLSVLVWNLFWWSLLCGVAIALFERFLPDNSLPLLAMGLSVLMLFNFGNIPTDVKAWTHPSWQRFEDLQLAYIRPFFPQIPVPLLLAYLAMQIWWSLRKRWTLLVAMGLLQWIAFGMFPYAAVMMAGITLIAATRELVADFRPTTFISMLLYAIACAAADVLFFLHRTGTTGTTGSTGNHVSLIRLDLTALHHIMGGTWFLLTALTILTAAARRLSPEVRWALIGLGLSCTAMMTGDLFFSENVLMVSHHGAYFSHATLAVLVTFLVSEIYHYKDEWRGLMRPALWVLVSVLAVNGMLVSEGTLRGFLPYNRELVDLATAVKAVSANDNDLVIAQAETVDDACSWIPLVSNAKVLYCRNAGTMLTADQYYRVQRFRQALYLYFTGIDHQQLIAAMHSPALNAKELRLAYGGIAPTNDEEKRRGLEEAQSILLPFVDEAEHHDSPISSFISRYGRIIVVDSNSHPIFDHQHLNSYLTVQQEKDVGSVRITVWRPKG